MKRRDIKNIFNKYGNRVTNLEEIQFDKDEMELLYRKV